MPNEDFYYQATHNDSAQVWDKFNKQESAYIPSHSYSDEKDAKKSNIGSLKNKDENIEDKYFGEPNVIYDQDEKYYKGTSFSPHDGSFSNNKYNYNNQDSIFDNPDNYLYFALVGIGLFIGLKGYRRR